MSCPTTWLLACFALASVSVCACSANEDADTIVIAPMGQSIALAENHEAPICRVLSRISGNRRGIHIDIAATASGTLVLADGGGLGDDWSCGAADNVSAASDREFRDCRATHRGQTLCPMSLARTLQALDVRFAQMEPSARGTVVLETHLSGDASAFAQTLTDRLVGFQYTEQVWISTHNEDFVGTLRATLDAAGLFNVRLALIAHVSGASTDAAWRVGADLVLVAAQGYTQIEDDVSRVSLDEGGTAWGVYNADSPADLDNLVRYEGIRLAIGGLAPALERRWGIQSAGEIDCLTFLQDNNLAGLFIESSGSCPDL